MEPFDLFISYRRKDADRVLPLVDAPRGHGLHVWLDQREIGDFAAITGQIRSGLANSKALLAWYSVDYSRSRPCQMELTAAYIAAQRAGDARQRVLVINPERDDAPSNALLSNSGRKKLSAFTILVPPVARAGRGVAPRLRHAASPSRCDHREDQTRSDPGLVGSTAGQGENRGRRVQAVLDLDEPKRTTGCASRGHAHDRHGAGSVLAGRRPKTTASGRTSLSRSRRRA